MWNMPGRPGRCVLVNVTDEPPMARPGRADSRWRFPEWRAGPMDPPSEGDEEGEGGEGAATRARAARDMLQMPSSCSVQQGVCFGSMPS